MKIKLKLISIILALSFFSCTFLDSLFNNIGGTSNTITVNLTGKTDAIGGNLIVGIANGMTGEAGGMAAVNTSGNATVKSYFSSSTGLPWTPTKGTTYTVVIGIDMSSPKNGVYTDTGDFYDNATAHTVAFDGSNATISLTSSDFTKVP